MSGFKIIIRPRAESDAEAAYLYIVEQGAPLAAGSWYGRLFNAISSLADFPHRCPLAPEADFFDAPIQQLVFGRYRILYTVDDARRTVSVLHIRHGARNALRPGDDEELEISG